MKKKNKKVRTILFWSIVSIIFLLANILDSIFEWFNIRFGVSFEEILFTITSPLEGSDVSFLDEAVDYVLHNLMSALPVLILMVVAGIVLNSVRVKITIQVSRRPKSLSFNWIYKLVCVISVCVMLSQSVQYGVESLALDDYVSRRVQKTTIYEDYYVKPTSEVISLEGEKKNIIYVYLESMETTYASAEDGGAQEVNYIPKLTRMAMENVSFSDTEKLGGANVTSGAGWTMGALLSSSSGVPFRFPVDGNSMERFEEFAPGLLTLGDVLETFDYKNVFLCGSDGNFAGRKSYFEQHGDYEVLDYYYAIEEGYIPEDYYVWWGYEDSKLYDIAKKELTKIAESSQPFNFTMLTVDTHHVDGYICDNCKDTYDQQLGNVLECADNQINDFVNWCKEQDFYENTVIVITGDHCRMDSSLVEGCEGKRKVYNCIINSDTVVENSKNNRVFSTLDYFPTTLSAMGFEIKGDRLGLGTDLFSDTPTLAEEMGFEEFNNELGKYSEFYMDEFQ